MGTDDERRPDLVGDRHQDRRGIALPDVAVPDEQDVGQQPTQLLRLLLDGPAPLGVPAPRVGVDGEVLGGDDVHDVQRDGEPHREVRGDEHGVVGTAVAAVTDDDAAVG